MFYWIQKLFDRLNPRLPNHHKDGLYYECHVTIEPVLEEKEIEELKFIASLQGFRLANLLMQKRKEDAPERSKYDTFMTGHSKTYRDLEQRMIYLIRDLQIYGYKVWRYKIEDTIMDSRTCDKFNLLEKK